MSININGLQVPQEMAAASTGPDSTYEATDIVAGSELGKMRHKGVSHTIETDTAAGKAWVMKHLHPPGTSHTASAYAGIPDRNNTPSTHAEYRTLKDFKCARDDLRYYNSLVFLVVPGINYPVYCFGVGGDGIAAVNGALTPKNFYVPNFIQSNGSYRIGAFSSTFYLNATGFNNQSTVTTAKFRPNIEYVSIYALAERYGSSETFRRCFPDYDDGYEVLSTTGKSRTGEKISRKLSATPGNVVQLIDLGTIPTEGTDVSELDIRFSSRPGREGAFMVNSFCNPTQPYKAVSDSNVKKQEPYASNGLQCFYTVTDQNTGIKSLLQFSDATQTGPAFDVPWYDGIECGFVIFEGLSVPADGGGAGIGLPYVTVKTVMQVEAQPLANSPTLPFLTPAVVEDEQALKLASGIMQQMPATMPASANDLGTILGTVATYLPTAVSWITKLFSKSGSKEQQGYNDYASKLSAQLKEESEKIKIKALQLKMKEMELKSKAKQKMQPVKQVVAVVKPKRSRKKATREVLA
jgi:hypothetical protein